MLLINLSPQTTYAYRAGGRFRGDGRSEVFSATRRFTTQKLPGVVDNEPVRFAVVGDLGQTAFSEKTMAEVNASRFEPMFLLETDKATYSSSAAAESQLPEPSLLMLVGDLSYADGDGRRWDRWGELFSPLLSGCPSCLPGQPRDRVRRNAQRELPALAQPLPHAISGARGAQRRLGSDSPRPHR